MNLTSHYAASYEDKAADYAAKAADALRLSKTCTGHLHEHYIRKHFEWRRRYSQMVCAARDARARLEGKL